MKKQKTKSMALHDVVGWYGSLAIVSGYFLSSFDIVNANSFLFQFINLTGASGLLYLGYKRNVKESMFLNTFWVIIGLVSIGRIMLS